MFNIVPASLRLGAVLARGSPGITLYLADLQLGKPAIKVAVKSLHTSSATPEAEPTLLEEVQMLHIASATCQRACCMLGCCKLDGDVCIVMSLYPKSADKRLAESQGPLGLEEVVGIAKDILEGLAQLHAHNILHLDLKPGNVLLDDYGHAFLSDFGISQALKTFESCPAVTSSLGTPHYMAPEQMAPEGGLRGSHTDVWGFATTVLHLATGHLPYPGLTHWQIMFAMSNRHLPEVPSSLPEYLQEALRSCLSFDTAARTSVSQLLQVIQAQASSSQSHLSPEAASTVARPASAPAPVNILAGMQQANQETVVATVCPGMSEPGAWLYLVSLLQGSNTHLQSRAADTMLLLARDESNVDAIITAGALPQSVNGITNESSRTDSSCACLRPGHDTKQPNGSAADSSEAWALLLASVKSSCPKVQLEAAKAVWGLTGCGQQCKDAVVASGALPSLVALLKSADHEVQATAARVMMHLSYGSQQNADAIISAGALPLLKQLLGSTDAELQKAVANAIKMLERP